ncbi:GMC type oxidoreductase, putative [Talaromyces stipitatus ATCC 10500]|uniref:GMC type oxidoreductase, putative n=1 Tax=Talaromyces stipitatus (strain ATCC 10500 / CBS 375.48 / QM 6759 / NRRL 1006) TaxID=441959 RepID=B8MQB4_TALSN|nr:GMC type oxidoreductase, putative [Talaromyces stipitatus ATCC 10500]EED13316.1 GMC type oxidoreductase, putative [Talaromyces stipitatus ATCC 10500]
MGQLFFQVHLLAVAAIAVGVAARGGQGHGRHGTQPADYVIVGAGPAGLVLGEQLFVMEKRALSSLKLVRTASTMLPLILLRCTLLLDPFFDAVQNELGLDEVDMTDGRGIGLDRGLSSITAINRTRSYGRTTAVSVTYRVDGKATTIKGKEIIVSGGAINTPRLLLLSGVGPKETLKPPGIEVVAGIPDVGSKLRDHALSIIELEVVPEIILHTNVNRTGILGSNNGFVYAAFRLPDSTWDGIDSSHHTSLPEDCPHILLEFSALPFLATPDSALTAWASLFQPEGSGSVTINTADYTVDPLIYTNYYSTEAERAAIIVGFKILMNVIQNEEIKKLTINQIYPTTPLTTDDEIWAVIQAQTDTFHHPMGTVAICIRVVDSSTFPLPVTCHPQATVYALANRAAKDIIAADADDEN